LLTVVFLPLASLLSTRRDAKETTALWVASTRAGWLGLRNTILRATLTAKHDVILNEWRLPTELNRRNRGSSA